MDESAPPLPPVPVLPPVPASSDDKIWAIFCHLSLMLGVGILLPLIVWLIKRDESPLIAAHAREALNFHLSLVIYSVAVTISALLVCFFLAFPVLLLMGLGSIILAIIAAVEASNGGFYRYPLTIPFFR